jgi:hypothetical protein
LLRCNSRRAALGEELTAAWIFRTVRRT